MICSCRGGVSSVGCEAANECHPSDLPRVQLGGETGALASRQSLPFPLLLNLYLPTLLLLPFELAQGLPELCRCYGDASPIALLTKMLHYPSAQHSDVRLTASLAAVQSRVESWCQQAEVVCGNLLFEILA